MNNKLLRLAQLIQERFPENIVVAFKSEASSSLETRLALTGRAIKFHQARAEALWLKAGKKRTLEEREAAACAELAAFLFACLTGDAREYADSAGEALRLLGRQGEMDLVKSLARS